MRGARREATIGVMGALFRDRLDAGRHLAAALEHTPLGDAVVVGLARGGVTVAAEVARRLSLPLDALAVRKIGYPWQPEYGIGAVTPGAGGVYLRSDEGLDDAQLRRVIEQAQAKADALDPILHERHRPLDLHGRTAVLIDDGLATGATMMAAVRWARSRGATRVVVAVPVGAVQSAALSDGRRTRSSARTRRRLRCRRVLVRRLHAGRERGGRRPARRAPGSGAGPVGVRPSAQSRRRSLRLDERSRPATSACSRFRPGAQGESGITAVIRRASPPSDGEQQRSDRVDDLEVARRAGASSAR